MKTTWGRVGLGLILMGGCLPAEGRRDRDVEPDTQSDTQADSEGDSADTSSFDTRADAEIFECGDCDDHDECTFDQCDVRTGQCQHLGVPGAAEPGGVPFSCIHDSDCDDFDACTIDSCMTLPGSCGAYNTTCVSTPIPGCNNGCEGERGCDDGNPCSDDYCLGDGSCAHSTAEFCVPECSAADLVTIAELASQDVSGIERVKTRGAVAPSYDNAACNDGPTCDCVMGVGLEDEGWQLGLRPLLLDGDAPDVVWQCQTHGCGELTVGCEPVEEGVTYRMWGRPVQRGSIIGVPAVPVAPGAGSLLVAGYCLDTTPESLVGMYDADLEVEPGTSIHMEAKMTRVDQGVLLAFSKPTCAAAGCGDWATALEAQTVVLEEGDGKIGFTFRAPTYSSAIDAHALLYSSQSRLIGRWQQYYGVPNGVALAVGGQMILTRRGTGRMLGGVVPF